MSEPYAAKWIRLAERVAEEWAIPIRRGVYAPFPGPCYETAAEIRAYAALGADAISMSTVPDHCGQLPGHGSSGCGLHHQHGNRHRQRKHTPEEVLRVARESDENSASGSDSCCCNGRGIRKRRERRRFPAKLVTKE